jgi:methylmalonyl-CoA/ethylmalonyl-CoA epimerase
MTVQLDHVGIVVSDLEETLAFFRDALGLEPERRVDEPGRARAAFLPAGEAFVELIEVTREGTPQRSGVTRIEHLGVRVDDLDAELERIRAMPLATETPEPVVKGGRRMIAVDAPTAGVRLQLIEWQSESA